MTLKSGLIRNIAFAAAAASLAAAPALADASKDVARAQIVAAKSGDVSAQMALADAYWADQRYRSAVTWYERAHLQGDAKASLRLALAFERGIGGFPKDQDAAERLYVHAATLGETSALRIASDRGLEVAGVD